MSRRTTLEPPRGGVAKKRWSAVLFLVSSALFASSACGSSDSGNLDQSACNPGDTRTCVGPGACKGGQSCGNDGNWVACDCGTGGASGASGAAGDASSSGGAAGVAGLDAGTAGSAAGGAAGSGSLPDAPCPSTPIGLNCSDTCGGPSANCNAQALYDMTCTSDHSKVIKLTSPTQFPYVIRTPSHPGTDARCTQGCTPPDTVWQLSIEVQVLASFAFVEAETSEPWRVQGRALTDPPSTCMGDAATCTEAANNVLIDVKTTDPDAPARNVTVRLTNATNLCP